MTRSSKIAYIGVALALVVGLVAAFAQSAKAAAGPCGTATTAPPVVYDHVVVVMMENRSASAITPAAAPWLSSLKGTCGYGSNYHGATHPSAPNYVAVTSGIPIAQLPATDCTSCKQAGPDIFTQGETWKAYEESMEYPCEQKASADGLYVMRHNPAHYFTDITAAACKANNVPYTALAGDLANDRLPAYTFITPNLANDMHNGGVTAGDSWLAREIPKITGSAAYAAGKTAIFIVWDEGSGTGNVKGVDCTATTTASNPSCNPPLFVISPYTTGQTSTANSNHYSLLATIETMLGLPALGSASGDLRSEYGL